MMIKLLVICEAFRFQASHKRWRLLAECYEDVDVTLIAPKKYIDNTWYPIVKTFKTEHVYEERFRVIPVSMKRYGYIKGGWLSYELHKVIRNIRPDFIYLIGFETNNVVYQIGLTRKFFFPGAKIATFTMRGLDFPLHKLHFRFRWHVSKKIFDAIYCHYPRGLQVLREQGNYNKPIYMQTQVGVDKDIFKPDEKKRKEIRNKYKINNQFVFGTASRMESSKGIFDVIDALPHPTKNWKLLMLGDGKEVDRLKKKIEEQGLEDRVLLTGYVSQGDEVAAHINAMDCFIHFPRTTKTWIDTFPLVVVQAMAVGLPVIGSDSGAVPYQLGDEGLIVPERDRERLNQELRDILKNPDKIKEIGNNLYNRVMNTFELKHLTKCFNITMREIIRHEYVEEHVDQTNFFF